MFYCVGQQLLCYISPNCVAHLQYWCEYALLYQRISIHPLSVTNSVALHLFTEVRLGTLFSPALVRWMDSIYAIALTQNTMTTGLIAYRIWRQDRASLEIGLRTAGSKSKSSLVPIVRIIIESAAIYVLTAIIIIILYARNNNFQYVIQEAIVPIIGGSPQ